MLCHAVLCDASVRLAVLRRDETAGDEELRERGDSLQVGGFRKGGGESSAATLLLLLPILCEGKSEVVFGYQDSGGVESGE